MSDASPTSAADTDAIVSLTLDFGARMHAAGGFTAAVKTSMQCVARGLGADVQPWVSPTTIGLATTDRDATRTAIRPLPAPGIDFTALSQLSQLAQDADAMSVEEIRSELASLPERGRRYPVPLVVVTLGLSCGSFAALLGSDASGAFLAGVGGLVGAVTRHVLHSRGVQPFLFCLFAALFSASVVMAAGSWSSTVEQAVTASVLFLVPGVPMLNGTADLLTSNYVNGLTCWARAMVIMLGTTLGFTMALVIWRHL